MRFYLGTHEPSWLRKLDVPLFVSRRRLARLRRWYRALAPWAMDSGGFTELMMGVVIGLTVEAQAPAIVYTGGTPPSGRSGARRWLRGFGVSGESLGTAGINRRPNEARQRHPRRRRCVRPTALAVGR